MPESNPERPIVLFVRAGGQILSAPVPTQWHQFGQTLAQIHNATDDFTDAPVRYDLEYLLELPLRELNTFLDEDSDKRRFLFTFTEQLRHNIQSLPPNSLNRGYCHGDFRSANLHWDEITGTVTTLDFELGGIGYRAYDLGYTWTNVNDMALSVLWNAPTLDNSEACWTAFLDGYTDCRQLSVADREAVPWFAALRVLMMMGYIVQTAHEQTNRKTWPPSEPGGLPGGNLFYQGLRFLEAWSAKHL